MSREREEAELRAALAPLRSRDEALARPFATMWSAAERRVATSRPIGRPYRWIAATSLAAIIVAVALNYPTALVDRPARHDPEIVARAAAHPVVDPAQEPDKVGVGWLHSVPPYVDPLSAWRSPTDFLLAASDWELWRGVPRFGLPTVGSITLPNLEI